MVNMTEKLFETQVYSLASAFGVATPLNHPESGASQGVFAVEGSAADTRNLHKRRRTKSAPWIQGRGHHDSEQLVLPQATKEYT